VKADKAFERGGIFVVKVQWFHDSVAKWERVPEVDYLIPRRQRRQENSIPGPIKEKDSIEHSKSTPAESSPTSKHDHGSEGVKVSALDGVGENGINSRVSAPEPTENPIVEEDDAVQAEEVSNHSVPQENGSMEVKIDWNAVDWKAIDKEVDEFLGSDDDDEDEDEEHNNSAADSEAVEGYAR
jgi:hypothetical protein